MSSDRTCDDCAPGGVKPVTYCGRMGRERDDLKRQLAEAQACMGKTLAAWKAFRTATRDVPYRAIDCDQRVVDKLMARMDDALACTPSSCAAERQAVEGMRANLTLAAEYLEAVERGQVVARAAVSDVVAKIHNALAAYDRARGGKA